jgi:hypothetical protein
MSHSGSATAIAADTLQIDTLQGQLMIWAVPTNGNNSYSLGNLSAGKSTWSGSPVLSMKLSDYLPAGTYTLIFVGLTSNGQGVFSGLLLNGGSRAGTIALPPVSLNYSGVWGTTAQAVTFS